MRSNLEVLFKDLTVITHVASYHIITWIEENMSINYQELRSHMESLENAVYTQECKYISNV